jgi:hypothetical protein
MIDKFIFIGLCTFLVAAASSSAGYQKGSLVGFKLWPQSDAQVETLINLRDSEDGVCMLRNSKLLVICN